MARPDGDGDGDPVEPIDEQEIYGMHAFTRLPIFRHALDTSTTLP